MVCFLNFLRKIVFSETFIFENKLSHGGVRKGAIKIVTYYLNDSLVDCVYGNWSDEFSGCSQTCGQGVKTMSRPIQVNSQYGGKPCSNHTIAENCFLKSCNGKWDIVISRVSIVMHLHT